MPKRRDPDLFVDCLNGEHGPIVDSEPRYEGETVQVDWICARCALILGEVSWSKEGWDQRKAKKPA